ncbi:hypothetical protein [Pontibacter vulgaris]|uniref:hypothetical protein n=1 Tax=Pontibacter vulgaris TaxID=2905679 RepID=UPI001FA78FE5|nr:hypothetical protein [Pontibacter vulgaris]
MYVSLYPQKELKRTKRSFLLAGIFLFSGGAYALVRELQEARLRFDWIVAAGIISLLGILALAVATDRLRLKDAYFSMTPEKISYRLGLYGNDSVLYWAEVLSMRVTETFVLFELQGGHKKRLSLSAIPAREVANHVATSLRLAAIEKNIEVNGVQMHAKTVLAS